MCFIMKQECRLWKKGPSHLKTTLETQNVAKTSSVAFEGLVCGPSIAVP